MCKPGALFCFTITLSLLPVTAALGEEIHILNKEEMTALYTGKTSHGKNLFYDKKINVTYNEDGTFKGTVADGKKKVSGTWKIKDDGSLCTTSREVNARQYCQKVYKSGDFYITFTEGTKIQFND